MKMKLHQHLWYGNTTLELTIPENWDIEICPMRGADREPLSIRQMEEAINRPIGSPPLKELARGKKKAVIIFDDMTRPTRAYEIAPLVIRELLAGGMAEENISFVCALGTHGALTQNEFRKKLGSEIIERFRVYNHNCYENCIEAGTTSRGTKILINREVMESDLKLGIGCITAHAQVGFSGGGKIILPGVAHMDSISHYHIEVNNMAPDTTGLGRFDNNILRFNIEEAARLAGLDFKIDVLVNARGETTALFAGDFLAAQAEGVKLAKEHYDTDPRPQNKDLAISNAFAKPNEMAIAMVLGARALKDFTGPVVIIADSPEGQVVHYLLGRFGQNYGGRQYPIGRVPDSIRLIIQAPHFDKTFADWYVNPEVVTFTRNWDQSLEILKEIIPRSPSVAVIPTATMQYFSS